MLPYHEVAGGRGTARDDVLASVGGIELGEGHGRHGESLAAVGLDRGEHDESVGEPDDVLLVGVLVRREREHLLSDDLPVSRFQEHGGLGRGPEPRILDDADDVLPLQGLREADIVHRDVSHGADLGLLLPDLFEDVPVQIERVDDASQTAHDLELRVAGSIYINCHARSRAKRVEKVSVQPYERWTDVKRAVAQLS